MSNLTARWCLVVMLAFAALHGPTLASRYSPNSWLYKDGAFYFITVKALAEHGRLEQKDLQPASWYERDLGWNRELDAAWSNVALGRGDRWYPKHPILLPLLAVPFYWLFGTPGTLVLNVLLNLSFVLLVFAICRRMASDSIGAVVAILVAGQPFIISASYAFSNDVLSGVLVVGTLEAVLGRRFRLAGVLAGAAIWARITHALFLPAFALIAWDLAGVAAVIASMRWALAPLGAFALHNLWLFGAPWTMSYQRIIVRHAGVMQAVEVTNNFTVPFRSGLQKIVFGNEGAFASFPLFGPGLAGLLFVRKPQRPLAAAVLFMCVAYLLALASYEWFRALFLYPIFGAAALGLAAIAQRIVGDAVPDVSTPMSLTRRHVAFAGAVVLISAVIVRLVTHDDPSLLSSRLEDAKVFLRDVPCDYFNPQNERWECSHFDGGESWQMTGRLRAEPLFVNGRETKGIWMHPHPSHDWRRLVFETLPEGSLALDFALGDKTQPGDVEVEVRVRGSEPEALVLSRANRTAQRRVQIPAGPGPALEVRVKAASADWKQFVWDGRLGG